MTGPRKTEYFLDNDFSATAMTFDLDTWFKVTAYPFLTNNILIKFKND